MSLDAIDQAHVLRRMRAGEAVATLAKFYNQTRQAMYGLARRYGVKVGSDAQS